MNSGHDLGGMHGFGPIGLEANEPAFHYDWERKAFSLTLAMGATGIWNIDASRYARESLNPGEYLTSSYYQIWLAGLIKLLEERDIISADEMAGATPERRVELTRILAAKDVAKVLASGGSTKRDTGTHPAFAIGDKVRVKNRHPKTHTRMPRYVRGHTGTIADSHGSFVLPDTNARGEGEQPEPCYGVRFEAAELWGDDGDPNHAVYADLWESYLERV
jgi:nitrile hydratase subunit beta